jgi:uncharacterized protein YggT (Ycf19 family)
MAIIDFILNLAGLLLWLSWRASRFDPLTRTSASSLAATLRRAEPRRLKSWHLLAGLAALLLGRAFLYSQIGPAVDWTPRLNIGLVVLAFRSDELTATLLYSLCGFGRLFAIFYFWMTALVILNRHAPENPILRVLRLQLGPMSRWAWPVQLLFPVLVVALGWMGMHPLMAWAGLINRVQAFPHLAAQGLVVGAALVFTLKYLLPFLMLVYLVSSYVYLGSSPVWDFVNGTARVFLTPLRKFPLRIGRVDLAPVVGTVVALVLLDGIPAMLLAKYPALRETIWPQ